MYNIDYIKLIKHTIPVAFRLPRMIAFITWLTQPIKDLHAQFLAYRTNANYELAHGSQVIYLEKYLNDRFDSNKRRISIIDHDPNDYPVFRTDAEDDTVIFRTDAEGGTIIMRTNEELYSGFDFTIEIDNALGNLTPDINELRACVDLRKLPGMIYNINILT